MAVHIGKKIKEEVYKQGLSITGFARKINRSRNVVYDIFERESVDTDLLNKIGKVLSCDFFSLYSSQKDYVHGGVKTFHANDQEASYTKLNQETFTALLQENTTLKNEVAYLKKIIALLETKKTKRTASRK